MVVLVLVVGVYQLRQANLEMIELRAGLVETYARLGRVVAELEDVVAETKRVNESVGGIHMEIVSRAGKSPF